MCTRSLQRSLVHFSSLILHSRVTVTDKFAHEQKTFVTMGSTHSLLKAYSAIMEGAHGLLFLNPSP